MNPDALVCALNGRRAADGAPQTEGKHSQRDNVIATVAFDWREAVCRGSELAVALSYSSFFETVPQLTSPSLFSRVVSVFPFRTLGFSM